MPYFRPTCASSYFPYFTLCHPCALLLNPQHCKGETLVDLPALVEKLCIHPKLNNSTMWSGLRRELAGLKQSCAVEAINDVKEYDFLKFHWKHRATRPNCYEAAKVVALSQPSSGVVGRIFSLMRSMFSSTQGRLLADARRLAVMLKYHNRD